MISAPEIGLDDLIAAILDDFAPAAIEDLAVWPLPPGGLWDPTYPPPPEPAPTPLHWRAFFATAESRDSASNAIRQQFPDVSLEFEDVPDEDWAARSQRELRAIRAGRFVVAPPWDRPQDLERGLTTILIEPSRGFGTGHHASTRLCLAALSDLEVGGMRVLDIGTGSGVLAMAAAFAGAREVVAIDVDPDAIEAARASAALNSLPAPIEFAVDDFRGAAGPHRGTFDLVLANLTGGMLTLSASRMDELLAPGAFLILSGFDESERPRVRDAFAHLRDHAWLAEEGWVGLVLRKTV